jgi:hypothetical protein
MRASGSSDARPRDDHQARHLHRHRGRGLSRGPCPAPSLTQSVAKILLEKSPLHAWHAHPRLNPDYQHDDATKFDIGNIAHKMLLGRGKEIVVLEDFDDWRTKAAKEAREEAAAAGKLAVLGKHAARADRMVNAAREQLELRGSATCSAPTATAKSWSRGRRRHLAAPDDRLAVRRSPDLRGLQDDR